VAANFVLHVSDLMSGKAHMSGTMGRKLA